MKILRWILFLPGSFVASLIGAFLGYYAGAVFGDAAAQTSAAFFGSLAAILTAGYIAPTHHTVVTIVLTSIVSLVALTAFTLSEFTTLEPYSKMPDVLKVLIPLAQILGGVYAIFWLQQLLASKLDYLLRKMRELVWCVASLGVLVTIVGLVVGLVNQRWLGLAVGLGILALAFVTWLLQKINLFVSTWRALKQRAGA
jgi:hypothetical protein